MPGIRVPRQGFGADGLAYRVLDGCRDLAGPHLRRTAPQPSLLIRLGPHHRCPGPDTARVEGPRGARNERSVTYENDTYSPMT